VHNQCFPRGGSGFSKAIFDQKIQQNLLDDFINSPESKHYIDFLPDDLVSLVRAIDDIELIMSHYLNLGYSGLPHKPKRSKTHQRGIIFLRMALAIYFRDKFTNTAYEFYENETKDFVEDYFKHGFISTENLIIVTTNYDLGLETVIEELYGKGSYYYPEFESRPQKKVSIPILKLHGSINWLEDRGVASDPGFRNSTRQNINKEVLNDLKVQQMGTSKQFTLQNQGRKYTPIMVPFFHQKSMWYEINKHWWGNKLDEVWKLAFDHISGAENISFWGYGLPSADFHMFSLLSEAMNKSQAFCEVVDYMSDEEEENVGESNLIKLMRFIYRDEPSNLRLYKQGLVDYFEWYFES
jgi:hypothetical protein